MKYKIYNQDVMEWAEQYEKGKFHALITDTPYNLDSITKRFGKKGSAPAKHGTDGVFQRSSKGFMNQAWDTDIAFQSETWEALGEHLYPGAFGMAFSGSRTWHRMAVAIEDAGFIIHPTIFLWAQGQGFPKATNIHKQLDKKNNVEGEVERIWTGGQRSGGIMGKNNGTQSREIHAAASEDSKIWEGHRYGLQALKPAVEPIIVFQKPYEGKPLDNITQTGAGAINIEGGRIGLDGGGTHCNNRDEFGNCLGHDNAGRSTTGQTIHAKIEPIKINRFTEGAKPWGNGAGHEYDTESTQQGRWPSNLILAGESAERLDAQTGDLISGIALGRNASRGNIYGNGNGLISQEKGNDSLGYKDSGGASRFFYNVADQIDENDPVYYCAKASQSERHAGVEDVYTLLPNIPEKDIQEILELLSD